jgi:hypothetical protein
MPIELIKRCTLEDKDFVGMVINHPQIRPFLSDDTYVGNLDPEVCLNNDKIVVLKYSSYGLMLFTPFNLVSYEIHFCLLPQYHHNFPYHYQWAIDGINWMFINTECLKILGLTVINFEHSEKAGLIKEGKITKAFMRNGILHDLYIYGACRDGWPWGEKNG